VVRGDLKLAARLGRPLLLLALRFTPPHLFGAGMTTAPCWGRRQAYPAGRCGHGAEVSSMPSAVALHEAPPASVESSSDERGTCHLMVSVCGCSLHCGLAITERKGGTLFA